MARLALVKTRLADNVLARGPASTVYLCKYRKKGCAGTIKHLHKRRSDDIGPSKHLRVIVRNGIYVLQRRYTYSKPGQFLYTKIIEANRPTIEFYSFC